MGDGGHIEFRKILMSAYCVKIFAQNLVERSKMITQRCPRDEKLNVGNRYGLFSSTIRYISTKFGTQLRKHTTIMAERANPLIMKIQDGSSRHIKF